ncbi:hypothetical protein KIN20_026984 [Parelaphostrongylus tenuis]|uniref:Uncharacterized protein n=1 Tax=Parelaphostrongylus tenuis TaxID=148309 RepID=A0AAD5QYZ8_PARTN|nr:hypothetical protein KIN20_026984 [Parelaphostrongylus tenuis]
MLAGKGGFNYLPNKRLHIINHGVCYVLDNGTNFSTAFTSEESIENVTVYLMLHKQPGE